MSIFGVKRCVLRRSQDRVSPRIVALLTLVLPAVLNRNSSRFRPWRASIPDTYGTPRRGQSSVFVEMTAECTGHVPSAEQSTDLRAKNAGHQFFPNALRSTSQVAPVAMSFSHNLSSGARLSSAIVMM